MSRISTTKVKSAGRFGSRYGVGIRKRLLLVEKKQHAKHSCPQCQFPRIKRVSRGIFTCGKCNHTFAGGTYLPVTLTGSIIQKMVIQKGYATYMDQLLSAKEKPLEAEEISEAVAEGIEAKKEKKAPKKIRTRKHSTIKK